MCSLALGFLFGEELENEKRRDNKKKLQRNINATGGFDFLRVHLQEDAPHDEQRGGYSTRGSIKKGKAAPVGGKIKRAPYIERRNGKLLGSSSSPIQIWKEGTHVEQSSTDIWHAICVAVRAACSSAEVAPDEVKGLRFAATCSLVAIDAEGSPASVSWSDDSRRNVIVWTDHRAVEQAERINSSNSPVLQYCGRALLPEMQPPKLLWVKENLPESWSMVFRWMDLSDWLSYRANGDDTRSLCTTVCKWACLGHAHMQQINDKDPRDMEACGWDDEFWEEIGLGDLVEGHHAKIGRSVAFPSHALGRGLTPYVSKELGLIAGMRSRALGKCFAFEIHNYDFWFRNQSTYSIFP